MAFAPSSRNTIGRQATFPPVPELAHARDHEKKSSDGQGVVKDRVREAGERTDGRIYKQRRMGVKGD